MGYTTTFDGSVSIVPPLNEKEIEYINKFSDTRRMHRTKGPYYVGGEDTFGQDQEDDVIDYNKPADGQPELWCQWITEDGTTIIWDSCEKFYSSTEWMQYLIDNFIGENPLAKLNTKDFDFLQGHVLNGTIYAQGEESDDVWKLVVTDNVVKQVQGHTVYDD